MALCVINVSTILLYYDLTNNFSPNVIVLIREKLSLT